MFEELIGKTAVITGAASGIGKETAALFAACKINTIILDVNETDGKIAADEICQSKGHCEFVYADLLNPSSIAAAFAKIRSQYKTIDILVNCAGISRPMKFTNISQDIWNQVIGINLTGTFLCIQEVIEGMEAQGYGKIVIVSSRSGLKGSKGWAAYSASKFGEIGLTQSLASEYAAAHINVNAICPGIVFTPMWEKQIDDYTLLKGSRPDNMLAELEEKIPMKRLQTTKDIANLALFLVSSMAENITGQSILVSGGY